MFHMGDVTAYEYSDYYEQDIDGYKPFCQFYSECELGEPYDKHAGRKYIPIEFQGNAKNYDHKPPIEYYHGIWKISCVETYTNGNLHYEGSV